jgi:hypothetical protein
MNLKRSSRIEEELAYRLKEVIFSYDEEQETGPGA